MRSSRQLLSMTLLALGGPAALGAVLGVRSGLMPVAVKAGLLAGIWLGVALLMTPALYIGTAVLGLPEVATRVPRAAVQGLRTGALVLLGLCPAVAFLVTTTADNPRPAIVALGGLAAAFAAILALRTVFLATCAPAPAGLAAGPDCGPAGGAGAACAPTSAAGPPSSGPPSAGPPSSGPPTAGPPSGAPPAAAVPAQARPWAHRIFFVAWATVGLLLGAVLFLRHVVA